MSEGGMEWKFVSLLIFTFWTPFPESFMRERGRCDSCDNPH